MGVYSVFTLPSLPYSIYKNIDNNNDDNNYNINNYINKYE